MKNKYFYYSELENGYLSIPSKLLYSLWDKKKEIVIEGENCSRTVLTGDYKGFICTDDYRVAKFKIDAKNNVLDAFRMKLFTKYSLHHEWMNSLFDIFTSKIFISPLKQLQGKEINFSYLTTSINESAIPENDGVWDNFLNECITIKNK